MSSTTALSHPDEMVSRLQKAMDPAHLALLHRVAGEATQKGLPLYIIGGFVRDLFIGTPGLDFDLVVEGDAVALARTVSARYGGRITVHSQFGTASWEPDPQALARFDIHLPDTAPLPPLDFVTARSETYAHPGALPNVQAGSLEDDLSRRDFTINTLALRLDGAHFGELVDRLGVLKDIRQRRVQVLHPESYMDDPTRILRAVRYEKRYTFWISPIDVSLIKAARVHLGSLSGERLRHELDLILAEPQSAAMLDRLQELNCLAYIHYLLAWDPDKSRLLRSIPKLEPAAWKDVPNLLHQPRRVALSWLLWLGRLEPSELEFLADRLDFTASLRESLLDLSALYKDLPHLAGAKPSQVVQRLDGVPLLAICAASLTVAPPVREVLEKYLSTWRFIKPRTTGEDLIKRGLTPGPQFKTILARLRQAWLDGEIKSESEETALLEQVIQK